MLIPVVYRVQIAAGATPGSLIANPQLIAEDGTLLDSGDGLPVKAGESFMFGPFNLHVENPAGFHHGKDHNATPASAPGGNVPGAKPATPQNPRR